MHAVQYGYPPPLGGQPVYSDTRTTVAAPQYPSKQPVPKNVAFELLLDENSKVRARIPMRVQIYPHDTTDSIVTTVKNFYGIYDGTASGVSFEDDHGNTLIARYENLRNNMTVYVRVIPVLAYSETYAEPHYGSMPTEDRKRPSLGEPFQMAPVLQPAPVLEQGQSPSHPASSIVRKRSMSPSNRSRRSVSQHKQSRAGIKNRASSTHGSFNGDETPEYSDSDGGYGSATGSKRARSEQHFASSEISMENILQDGRRKRPKFESSVSYDGHAAFIHLSNHQLLPLGIAVVRPSSGSDHHVSLFHLAATSLGWPRDGITVRPSDAAPVYFPTTVAVSSELWV